MKPVMGPVATLTNPYQMVKWRVTTVTRTLVASVTTGHAVTKSAPIQEVSVFHLMIRYQTVTHTATNQETYAMEVLIANVTDQSVLTLKHAPG